MSQKQSAASDLVMTQAELPPGIDVPPPTAERDRIAAGGKPPVEGLPTDLLRDIHALADRVGGLGRLRDVIDELAALPW